MRSDWLRHVVRMVIAPMILGFLGCLEVSAPVEEDATPVEKTTDGGTRLSPSMTEPSDPKPESAANDSVTKRDAARRDRVRIDFDTFKQSLSEREFDESDRAKVILVPDANTIVLKKDQSVVRVALAGLEPPERVEPEVVGRAQSEHGCEFLRNLIMRRDVYVEREPAIETDVEGYLPVYVYRADDGLFVNLEMIGRGYAYSWEDPLFMSWELFQRAEGIAQEQASGFWDPEMADWSLEPDPETVALHRKIIEKRRRRRARGLSRIRQAYSAFVEANAASQKSPYIVGGSSPSQVGGSSTSAGDQVQVRGYFRSDGTYVRSHTRSRPN